ncbi:hypothetical protein HDU79_011452 [Rhizoclosmatium sp. JEL0117]|nr:hypothetical protein HDU79_011452 [Rhizoclosmatium sp. JEL0117]
MTFGYSPYSRGSSSTATPRTRAPRYDVLPEFTPPTSTYNRKKGVKACTRGWINERGEFNLNMKVGSYGHSRTHMARPSDLVSSLYSIARDEADCFGGLPKDVKMHLFYQKKDLVDYLDCQLGELGMEAVSTVIIKYYLGDEQVTNKGFGWEFGSGR